MKTKRVNEQRKEGEAAMKNFNTILIVGLISVLGLVWVPNASAQSAEHSLGFVAPMMSLMSVMSDESAPAAPEVAVVPEFTMYVGRTGNKSSDVAYIRLENISETPCSIRGVTLQGPGAASLRMYYQDPGVSFKVAKPVTPKPPKGSSAVNFGPTYPLLAATASTDPKKGIDPGETLVLIIVPQGGVWAREIWEDVSYGDITVTITVQYGSKKDAFTMSLTALPELPPG
jgi:hypothetical protein